MVQKYCFSPDLNFSAEYRTGNVIMKNICRKRFQLMNIGTIVHAGTIRRRMLHVTSLLVLAGFDKLLT